MICSVYGRGRRERKEREERKKNVEKEEKVIDVPVEWWWRE